MSAGDLWGVPAEALVLLDAHTAPVTVGLAARRLDRNRSTVGNAFNRLRLRGLVERHGDPWAYRYTISEAGRVALAGLRRDA